MAASSRAIAAKPFQSSSRRPGWPLEDRSRGGGAEGDGAPAIGRIGRTGAAEGRGAGDFRVPGAERLAGVFAARTGVFAAAFAGAFREAGVFVVFADAFPGAGAFVAATLARVLAGARAGFAALARFGATARFGAAAFAVWPPDLFPPPVAGAFRTGDAFRRTDHLT